MDLADELPPASRIASAWQPVRSRAALVALLALDERLARVVTQLREPVLAQVRLAWWRDRLREAPDKRPVGEPLLAAIGDAWRGHETLLIGLVDGWEEMIGESAWSAPSWRPLADARADAFGELAAMSGAGAASSHAAGYRWSLADLAARAPDTSAADNVRQAALGMGKPMRLPSSMRGVAVLDALAHRALRRREPMLAGRAAALLALRVGMVGR